MQALLLVDIQNDFLPGGALPVPRGDQVVPVANAMIDRFRAAGDLVVATKDYHPAHHGSFASQHPGHNVGDIIDLNGLEQVLWPDHCVAASPGAQFAARLRQEAIAHVIHKGTDPQIDSYSGFFDNGHRKTTGLANLLYGLRVNEVHVMGLATDYCVKFTAIDAAEIGFKTRLILDGCRGVELHPGDCERALDQMRNAGVVIV